MVSDLLAPEDAILIWWSQTNYN